MTDRKTINKLNSDPSKSEEIAFFNEVAESIPAAAYLKDFFTPLVIGWVESQIRSDFPPDIWEFLNQAETVSKLRAELATAYSENADLTAAVDHLNAQVRRQSEESVNDQNRIDQMAREKNDLRNEIYSRETEIEDLKAQIVSLKVKLFDIQNPDLV